MASALERHFDLVWQALGGPDLEHEFRFYAHRQWRFDRAWIAQKVAFEVEGGAWVRGRHTHGAGFADDCHKYNAAAALGWRVFRLTGDMITIALLGELLEVLRGHGGTDFRFARKGGRARRFKPTPKGRLTCNSLRRSGGAPNSNSP